MLACVLLYQHPWDDSTEKAPGVRKRCKRHNRRGCTGYKTDRRHQTQKHALAKSTTIHQHASDAHNSSPPAKFARFRAAPPPRAKFVVPCSPSGCSTTRWGAGARASDQKSEWHAPAKCKYDAPPRPQCARFRDAPPPRARIVFPCRAMASDKRVNGTRRRRATTMRRNTHNAHNSSPPHAQQSSHDSATLLRLARNSSWRLLPRKK